MKQETNHKTGEWFPPFEQPEKKLVRAIIVRAIQDWHLIKRNGWIEHNHKSGPGAHAQLMRTLKAFFYSDVSRFDDGGATLLGLCDLLCEDGKALRAKVLKAIA
jgi:hypothetical protein